jgi:hypothetical protein
MIRASLYLAPVVIVLGVLALVVGSLFIAEGIDKSDWMKEAMREEQLTFGLTEEDVTEGALVDSRGEAEYAADTIREHRRGIAPSYQELLGEGRYDPTNSQHLSYAQALNLENYLYLAVLGLGVTEALIAQGAVMVVLGLALGMTGVVLFGLARRTL